MARGSSNKPDTASSRATAGADGAKDVEHAASPASPSAPDELQRISGIGPSLERKLHKAGITSFAQIVAMSDGDLQKLEDELKVPGGVDWDAWKGQAAEFMDNEPKAQTGDAERPAPAAVSGASDGGAKGMPVSGPADPPAAETPEDNGDTKPASSDQEPDAPPAKPPPGRDGDGAGSSDASPSPAETATAGFGGGGGSSPVGHESPVTVSLTTAHFEGGGGIGPSDADDNDDPYGADGYLLVVKTKGSTKQRRRAGYAFTPEEKPIPANELRLSQVKAIDDDPELEAHLVDAETGEVFKPRTGEADD